MAIVTGYFYEMNPMILRCLLWNLPISTLASRPLRRPVVAGRPVPPRLAADGAGPKPGQPPGRGAVGRPFGGPGLGVGARGVRGWGAWGWGDGDGDGMVVVVDF